MTPRQLFRVVAATLGLWYLLRGLSYLFNGLLIGLKMAEPQMNFTANWYAARGIFGIIVGFFIMCGVPAFDRIAFPRHHKEVEGGSDATRPEPA